MLIVRLVPRSSDRFAVVVCCVEVLFSEKKRWYGSFFGSSMSPVRREGRREAVHNSTSDDYFMPHRLFLFDVVVCCYDVEKNNVKTSTYLYTTWGVLFFCFAHTSINSRETSLRMIHFPRLGSRRSCVPDSFFCCKSVG